MPKPIQWAAQIEHVREITLSGHADLSYWRETLAQEELIPIESAGHAKVQIMCAQMKYFGISFSELSVSVSARAADESRTVQGGYLVGAFNSCRFFAYCERKLFSTPYSFAKVSLQTETKEALACATVLERSDLLMRMELANPPLGQRLPEQTKDEIWQGAVFLPARGVQDPRKRKLFWASLQGLTRTYPYLAAHDTLSISLPPKHDALRALADSRFIGREWKVRLDARHAKSKTYPRDVELEGLAQASGETSPLGAN